MLEHIEKTFGLNCTHLSPEKSCVAGNQEPQTGNDDDILHHINPDGPLVTINNMKVVPRPRHTAESPSSLDITP